MDKLYIRPASASNLTMASTWISYNELAWTEELLSDTESNEKEVSGYVELIREAEATPVQSLLHLGCGAGGHDHIFKIHFKVTGVDLSTGMLDIARSAHSEIDYHEGDMCTLRLNKQFDAVAIPDSIDYLTTVMELQQAIHTAAIHLKTGGVLLVAGKTKETFQNNNFAYSGEKGDIHVMILENNYIHPYKPDTYEISLLYLIREQGVLTSYFENTTAGLFPHSTWEATFRDAGFSLQVKTLDGLYDKYLLGEGEYKLTNFLGIKE